MPDLDPAPHEFELRSDIRSALNRASAENGSDTPDFILASYLIACLAAFDEAVLARDVWYGRTPGNSLTVEVTPDA